MSIILGKAVFFYDIGFGVLDGLLVLAGFEKIVKMPLVKGVSRQA